MGTDGCAGKPRDRIRTVERSIGLPPGRPEVLTDPIFDDVRRLAVAAVVATALEWLATARTLVDDDRSLPSDGRRVNQPSGAFEFLRRHPPWPMRAQAKLHRVGLSSAPRIAASNRAEGFNLGPDIDPGVWDGRLRVGAPAFRAVRRPLAVVARATGSRRQSERTILTRRVAWVVAAGALLGGDYREPGGLSALNMANHTKVVRSRELPGK